MSGLCIQFSLCLYFEMRLVGVFFWVRFMGVDLFVGVRVVKTSIKGIKRTNRNKEIKRTEETKEIIIINTCFFNGVLLNI